MKIAGRLLSIKAVLLFLSLLIAAPFLGASEYLYRKVSLEQGLSQGSVTSFARDGRGFLWIGTRFGLNRYDFEKIDTYYHDPSRGNSLPNNYVRKLFVDSKGHLWVACERGLARYKDRTDDFEPITQPDGRGLNVRSFIEEDGGLLLGGAGNFWYYDYESQTVSPLAVDGGSTYYYTDIHRWMPGYYVVSTRWDGLWLFDREKSSLSRLPGVNERGIMATAVDSRGMLWVSPYGQGIFVYDRAGKRSEPLLASNSALPNDIILDIVEYDGKMWLGTDGGGVAVYDPESSAFVEGMGLSSLAGLGAVVSLYADGSGNVFAGTVRDGAVAVCASAMRTIHGWGNNRWNAVTSLCHDDDGTLWLGDDGNGVFRNRAGTDSFEQISSTARLKITDLESLDRQRLLIVTFDRGFFILDKVSGRLSAAPEALRKVYEGSLNRAMPMRLRRLSDGKIAVIADAIYVYSPSEDTVMPAERSRDYPEGGGVLWPFYNKDGRLLCLDEKSITEYNPVTGGHTVLLKLPSDVHAYCAAFDGVGTVYVGTEAGVVSATFEAGVFSALQDISQERITTMSIDSRGRLWAGSSRTVYMKVPEAGNVTGFSLSDGVTPNEYLPNAVAVCGNRLYLGGANGLLRIDCDDVDGVLASYEDPALNVADIKIDGLSAYGRLENGRLEVAPRCSSISISLIDNGSRSMRGLYFRYHIRSGRDEHIVETFSRNMDLNFLDAGKDYDIYASSIRPDGTWTRPHKLATLAMLAPWWQSWEAIALLIVLVAGSYIWWEYRRARRRRSLEEAKIEALHSNALEKEVAFLVNANYALRTPLTLIYAPVKLLLERLREGMGKDELLPQLENIYRNTKRMRDTIDMVLELHNVGASPASPPLSTHDISRSVEDVIAVYKRKADAKNIVISYLSAQEMFPAVYDRARLATVIDTLLRNAVQRSSEHSAIAVRAFLDGSFVRVSISDTGEPLDEETLAGLFSRYFNDDNSNFGNSLGFAYVKNIIESHGGHIGADNNTDGPGLTVWFDFPVAEGAAAEAYLKRRRRNEVAPPAPCPVVADIDTSGLTAVVVEEDNDLCIFIASQLAPYFGRVLHAFNGKDALLLIHQNQPDIVISSVMLPQKSGLELCRDIKSSSDTSHIPVILLTSIKEGNALEQGYGAGADSYLTKPFDVAVLMARCRNLLHNRSVMRERYAERPGGDVSRRSLRNAEESFIIKIDKIIADNLSDPEFGVDIIVESMALSRSALYSKFKEIAGMSIGAYIADKRLARAKELLADFSLSVGEISEMLGFGSQRYFSTFFKDRTGMSPSAFRNTLTPP